MSRQAPLKAVSNAKSVSAGRGLVFITVAKLWFMVAGYVVQFALPRALGSPARYGVYVVVLSLLSPVNNVMVQATIQGVSKFTSEIEARQGVVLRAALKLQAMLGGGVALAFFLIAPLISWFEHDSTLTPYLQLASGVALAYAFYAVFVGAANGRKEFHKQAGLDMTYSTLRCLFIVGAAAATHSAMAAVGGFVAAAAVVLVLSIFVVGFGKPSSEPFDNRVLLKFFSGVAFYLLIVNLLMFTDGLLLKREATEWAAAHGIADPSMYGNEQAGFYGAVQNVARIPYQLILAVTYVIFPLISKSTFENDLERTRGYVRNTMRYSLVVAALISAVLAARPDATMRLFYKPEYAVGAHALGALVAGYVAFSLFNIAGTIINGSGRTLPTTVIGVVTLAATVAAEWIGLGMALGRGHDALFVAATVTAATMTFGLVLSAGYLWRTFGAALPLLSLVRVAAAYAAALATGWAWNRAGLMPGKIGTIASSAVIGVVYLVVCVATGELRPAELKRLRG
ncbi:MAG TPA: oligosaccharide flippase family protein [Polyangia bacterium]|jgi:O-antigen/teichoic acid export membrane protein